LAAPLLLRTNRPRPRAVSPCCSAACAVTFTPKSSTPCSRCGRVPLPQKPRAQRARAARPPDSRRERCSCRPGRRHPAGAGRELPCTVNLQAYPWPAAHAWKNILPDGRSSRSVRLQVVRHRSCQGINITYGTANSCHHGGVSSGTTYAWAVDALRWRWHGSTLVRARSAACRWPGAMIDRPIARLISPRPASWRWNCLSSWRC
jgi:hypothetical protein